MYQVRSSLINVCTQAKEVTQTEGVKPLGADLQKTVPSAIFY